MIKGAGTVAVNMYEGPCFGNVRLLSTFARKSVLEGRDAYMNENAPPPHTDRI